MTEFSNSASYHLLSTQSDEQQLSISEETSTENEKSSGKSSFWKAVVNIMSAIEGTGLLGLPYVIARSGLVAVAALLVIPMIAYYTGARLIDCLYEKNEADERVRIRSNYKELGEACWPRFGGTIVAAVQLIELFLYASLFLVLCASLASSIYPALSNEVWMLIAAAIAFPAIFLKNLSQVAWLSLLSVIALLVAVIVVLAFGIAHHSTWDAKDILVWDINGIPIGLAIIIFSYICHPILPGVEESMENRSQYRSMLAFSFIFVAIFKIVFSVCAFLSFSSNINEVIVNSLPMGIMHMLVNGVLIINVIFSYPFIVLSILQVIEDSVSSESFPCKIPDLVWFIGVRVMTSLLTVLPAISIPHFALFMAFIGSLTGSCVAFIFPAIFHLMLKKKEIKLYHYVFDVLIVIFGILASILGIVFTGMSLVKTIS